MSDGLRTTPLVHPVTGAVLDDDLDTLAAYEARVDKFCRGLSVHYDFRRQLRERIAELRGKAVLPRPRYRTDRQNRVAECPRCGSKT